VKTLLARGVIALSAAVPCAGALAAEPLSSVVVTAPSPGLDLSVLPSSSQSLTADAIARTISVTTPEDTLRYLPSLLVRQRHIGDTQSPVATRTAGVGASARSLIYVDGMLISSLIGNNNTSASPKWGLIAPDAIERVDVLYGPFSAAYAGNAIGGVIAFATRMPKGLEAGVALQGAVQGFSQYADRKTYAAGRFAADLGDRRGGFAFRLAYNHLDAAAQPLAYVTAAASAVPSASRLPVTGAVADANRNGQPIVVLGAAAFEHQVQDNISGRATLDLTPDLRAAFTVAAFRNSDRSTVNSYLRDAGGVPVYAGAVNFGGRAYTLSNSAFSNGVYRLDELQLAQGLSLGSHAGGVFDFEVIATAFDDLHSRQRIPSAALPAAFVGGGGSATALDGTGWRTLDASGTWRPFGVGGVHIVTFGAHYDSFRLNNPRYALVDWISGSDGAVVSESRGRTRTQALWVQDIWSLGPRWRIALGGRWELWQATDGINASVSPALDVVQPRVAAAAFSPKAVLTYAMAPGWTLKAAAGLAYRFPTVTELYQAVTVGTLLQTPNPNLRPERALSTELSAERSWPSGSVRLSAFDERITDALLSQTALLPSGAPAIFVQNIDRTHATGVEMVADRKDILAPGLELSGWITYVDARIDRDRAFPAAVGKALPQLPRWRGALVVSYAPTPKLDITVAGRYSDRAFATLDNSDRHADAYQGFAAYFVLDLHVRYRVTPRLTAGLGVDNFNDRSYFLFHPFPRRTVIADLRYSY
jgi:iron complex outermembrane receptor protein